MVSRWQAKKQRRKAKIASLNAENFEEIKRQTAEKNAEADENLSSETEREFLLANTQSLQPNEQSSKEQGHADSVAETDDFARAPELKDFDESHIDNLAEDNNSVDTAITLSEVSEDGVDTVIVTAQEADKARRDEFDKEQENEPENETENPLRQEEEQEPQKLADEIIELKLENSTSQEPKKETQEEVENGQSFSILESAAELSENAGDNVEPKSSETATDAAVISGDGALAGADVLPINDTLTSSDIEPDPNNHKLMDSDNSQDMDNDNLTDSHISSDSGTSAESNNTEAFDNSAESAAKQQENDIAIPVMAANGDSSVDGDELLDESAESLSDSENAAGDEDVLVSEAQTSPKEPEHDFATNIDYSALGLDFLEDDGVVAVHNNSSKKKANAAEDNAAEEVSGEDEPADTEAFKMDDEYLKAFNEEGASDDFIYAPNTAIKESLLNKIADGAEELAEEGTKTLEKQEQEKAEAKLAAPEVLVNENGEPIDKNGKIILKRTLENKLCLAETRERRYYNMLKNELLSYMGVKDSLTQQTDTFKIGRATIARLTVTGNCNRLYLALDPMEYDIERYRQSDVKVPDFDDTLMMVKINDDESYAIAIELLTLMMGQRLVDKQIGFQPVDYLPQYPRRADAVLDEKGKLLAGEAADDKALEKERRVLERKANVAAEEKESKEEKGDEKKEEPLTILPLTMENKLHQSVNSIKKYYSKLKNELLSYKNVKSNITQSSDNFKAGKLLLAKLVVVGNNLRLYLALNPEDYKDNKFHQRNVKDQKDYADTPMMVKVTNDKEYKNAVELIVGLVKNNGLLRNKRYVYEPYAEKYPYIKNAIFKGDEGKPLPDLKSEEYTDIYGELTEHLRSQYGEVDAWGVPKGYTAEDGLSARELMELHRQKAKTLNAGVALATPIVFFYDIAINSANEVQYVNVQQVLNDKFLGKMLPQYFFAIAEGSNRIEELNFIMLENVRKDCEENPGLKFVVKVSCRLLLHEATLTKLAENIITTNKNLILAFDCAMLEAIGYLGVSGINALKNKGALIMLDNAESASMRVLTEYEFDYLRLDARYYSNDSAKRLAHLDMLTGYAAMQNILSTSINCEHPEDARVLLDHGVKIIQGDAVSRPMRLIGLALKNIKAIPKVRKHG